MARLILDCDTKNEIDDQFAITYAIGCERAVPGTNVLGVVNVQNTHANGPDSVTIYQEEARLILEALGRTDIPNLRGAEKPLSDDRRPGTAAGVEFIIEAARADDPEPLYVVGTGPATDLASAIMRAPDIQLRATFVWLGGVRNAEMHKQYGEEWNKIGDPWAAKSLFESKARLIHVPAFGVTQKLVWQTGELVEALRRMGRPIHLLLANRVITHMKDWRGGRKEFWDIGAVDVVVHPEWHTIIEQPAHGFGKDAAWVIPGRGTRTISFVDDLQPEDILAEALNVLRKL